MRTTLLMVLAALLCALAVCIDVMPMKDFNLEKGSGKWYKIAVASNDPATKEHKATMRMATVVDAQTAEGNLIISIAVLRADGTCDRTNFLADKTDTPGRYIFRTPHWNYDMRVVDVQYDDYGIVLDIITGYGVTVNHNTLFGRTREVSTAVQQRFREFCLAIGIPPDNIIVLPYKGECPEE